MSEAIADSSANKPHRRAVGTSIGEAPRCEYSSAAVAPWCVSPYTRPLLLRLVFDIVGKGHPLVAVQFSQWIGHITRCHAHG